MKNNVRRNDRMTEKGTEQETNLVVITGMSGAGKTVAVQSFEDLGYYCVDNLPPTLLPKFLELMRDSANNIHKVALVMDLRGREFFDSLFESLDTLSSEDWIKEHILFLDAKDEQLVSRYKETRRSHPLSVGDLPIKGIQKERKIIDELRCRAQRVSDTRNLKPKDLSEEILRAYTEGKQEIFRSEERRVGKRGK